MNNRKSKSRNDPTSDDDDFIKNDGNVIMYDFFSMDARRASEDKGDFTMGVGQVNEFGSSSAYGGSVGYIGGAAAAPAFRPVVSHEIPYGSGSNHGRFYGDKFLNAFGVPVPKRYNVQGEKACKFCRVNDTPLWRKGPDDTANLCNACGLKYMRQARKKPE